MNNGEFVAAYTAQKYYGPQHNNAPEALFTDPTLERSLVDVRGWGRHFSSLMRHRLNDRPVGTYDQLQKLTEYERWNIDHLDRLVEEVYDAVADDPRAIRYAGELTFHLTNSGMIDQWRSIIYYRANRTFESAQYRGQTMIAATAIKLLELQDEIKDDDKSNKEQRISFIGSQITELDAGIALLELAKTRKETLAVVPAPPDFEATYAERNADFLLLDRGEDQIHGIQVKNSLTRPSANKIIQQYDPDFITLIDGAIDLGNQVYIDEDGQPLRFPRTRPGLLSIDQMQRVSMNSLMHDRFSERRWEMIEAWNDAKERASGRNNFIHQAMKNIEPRIIHGLYKEPARTFVKPERLEA